MVDVNWGRRALRHIERRREIALDEIRQAIDDPHHDFRRVRGRRYRLIGRGNGRILTLIVEDVGEPVYALVTARTANEIEKRLYRRRGKWEDGQSHLHHGRSPETAAWRACAVETGDVEAGGTAH